MNTRTMSNGGPSLSGLSKPKPQESRAVKFRKEQVIKASTHPEMARLEQTDHDAFMFNGSLRPARRFVTSHCSLVYLRKLPPDPKP